MAAATSQWYEATMSKISAFREEQELKLTNSFATRSGTSATKQTALQTKMILNNKNNKDSIDFFDLVDKSLLIIASSIANPSCWPLALTTYESEENKREKSADLGTLDSNGSVWKMTLRPDAYPGTRVILQSSEIGEQPMYLRADLTFHEFIEVAAIWTVYTVSSNPSTDYGDNMNNHHSTTKALHEGTIVRFELFEGVGGGYNVRTEARYLVSVVAKTGQRGIALMNSTEMKEDEKEKELSFGLQWELIGENVEIVDDGMDAIFVNDK